jgi:hypothetical protein
LKYKCFLFKILHHLCVLQTKGAGTVVQGCEEAYPGTKVFSRTVSLLTFCLTSAPFCLAEQWLMFSVPDIKSFWTSTTRNMLTGRTICKQTNIVHSSTFEEALFLLWD